VQLVQIQILLLMKCWLLVNKIKKNKDRKKTNKRKTQIKHEDK